MKKNCFKMIGIAGLIAFSSCTKKAAVTVNSNDTVNATTTAPIAPGTPAIESKTVEGIVKTKTPGKDGYTAALETAEGIYFVTISHSNLTNHEQYREVKLGDSLKVSGDFWKMDDKNQITVRVIE